MMNGVVSVVSSGVDSPDHTHQFGTFGGSAAGAGNGPLGWFGGPSGPVLGPYTVGASTRHTHSISGTTASGGANHQHTIALDGQTETRPYNVAMNYIIKT